jgi:hypothetical protein
MPAFGPSAVHTGLINRPIPAPNSLIFSAPRVDPVGLLCCLQVENKSHFVGVGPCEPIFRHLITFKF